MCKICEKDSPVRIDKQGERITITCLNCGMSFSTEQWENMSEEEISAYKKAYKESQEKLAQRFSKIEDKLKTMSDEEFEQWLKEKRRK